MTDAIGTNEWDSLVYKIGKMTLAMGLLEAAVMAMHCTATGQREADLESKLNKAQRKGLKTAAQRLGWTDEQVSGLAARLSEIAALDKRRNRFIHIAAGIMFSSIPGVSAGSVVDARSYGLGVTSHEGNSRTFGVVVNKIDLSEVDELTADIHAARLNLVPYMELIDAIEGPSLSLAEFVEVMKNAKPGEKIW